MLRPKCPEFWEQSGGTLNEGGALVRNVIAAMATPLDAHEGFSRETAGYTRWLAEHGVGGLMALGFSGEGVLLGPNTWLEALEAIVQSAGLELPVGVPCAGLSRDEVLWRISSAVRLKVSAVAVMAPVYYALSDQELAEYFHDIFKRWPQMSFYLQQMAAPLPAGISPSLYAALRRADGNLRGIILNSQALHSVPVFRAAHPAGEVLWGGDARMAEAYELGVAGVVSDVAAALPDVVAEAWRALSDSGSALATKVEQLDGVFQPLGPSRAVRLILQAQGRDVGNSPKPIKMPSSAQREEFFRKLAAVTAGW